MARELAQFCWRALEPRLVSAASVAAEAGIVAFETVASAGTLPFAVAASSWQCLDQESLHQKQRGLAYQMASYQERNSSFPSKACFQPSSESSVVNFLVLPKI